MIYPNILYSVFIVGHFERINKINHLICMKPVQRQEQQGGKYKKTRIRGLPTPRLIQGC